MPDLKDLVAATGELATLPATLVELLEILNDPTVSATRVQKVLERDPAMTANVLKISNSAFFGARREIASVRDALVMLGNRRTATLAFATGMSPVMRRDLLGYGITREQFWAHSLLAAASSATVAVRLGHSDLQCEAFTGGLIHDVGMLVLDPALVAAKISLEDAGLNIDVCLREIEVFGFDHCQAGARLGEAWGFPEILVEPIAWHHNPGGSGSRQPLVQAVTAGCLLAQSLGADIEGERPGQLDHYLRELGLGDELVAQLRLDLPANLGEICDAATALVPVMN